MKKKVLILTASDVEKAAASTQRKLAIAKGFEAHHIETLLVSYKIFSKGYNYIPRGSINGINYVNIGFTKPRISIKLILYIIVLLKLYWLVIKEKSKNDLLIWSNMPILKFVIPFNTFCHLFRVKIFYEVNESPTSHIENKSKLYKLLIYYQFKIAFRYYDLICSMTYTLKRMLIENKYCKKEIKILSNCPDIDRFSSNFDYKIENVITYVGALSYYKDGIDLMLKVFAIVSIKDPNVRLKIVTFSNSRDIDKARILCKELNIEKRVDFVFDVEPNKIPNILSKSRILILTRRVNELTEYGFPTKMVEYIAANRPIVTTKVSDLEYYFNSSKHVLFSKSQSLEDIAFVLLETLKIYDCKINKDIDNSEILFKHFNPFRESKKIIDFFWSK